jgi:histidine triad (HIT) family protein
VSEETYNCLFCKIAAKKIPSAIVHDDGDVVAFHDISPKAPTHVLFIPRKHIPSVAAIDDENVAEAGKVLAAVASYARKENLSDFRLVINNGEGAGQSVFHLHVHLLAGRPFDWPPG